MEIKSEERMNRFVKKRSSNFRNDNPKTNPAALKNGGSSKWKQLSDFNSRIKSNELVTVQVGIISGDKKRRKIQLVRKFLKRALRTIKITKNVYVM